MRPVSVFVLLACASMFALHAADESAGFTFNDQAGQYLDVLYNGKIVGRYMYAYDKSTPARLNETYKPYLHVFDAEGKAPITNGAGAKQYPHHRGIFVGWNKIGFGGKTYDRWHMKGGEQVHQKFSEQKTDKDQASFTSVINYNDEAGKPFMVEERTMTFRRAPAPAYVLVDLRTTLKATEGDVTLDGDPEHAGIHYRPAEGVNTKETLYVFPKEDAKPHADFDYPWAGETYTLGGKKYSVVIMSHPDNPKKTKWSAYRDYGRFGAFPKAAIKSGEALTLKYRFLVAEGDMPAVDAIQTCCNQFTGLNEPAPKTVVIPAEQPKPAVKKGEEA
ncbi:MAG: PmoA family protein, partial [Planctomycetota bacterium]